jgi:RNA 2',3'-cyclic 3'-phosphodiesterase
MNRLFCAIKIPPSHKLHEAMATLKEALASDRIKWVDLQNLHLTLKFFGETTMQMEKNIIRALETAAQNTSAFTFDLEGCGSFGPPRSPRVLWIGASRAVRLITLYEQIHKYIKPYGYEPDKKDYSPHLTLGRIKSIRDYNFFKQLTEVYKQTHFGQIKVDRFYLYQSILKAEGPEYKVVEEFLLSK